MKIAIIDDHKILLEGVIALLHEQPQIEVVARAGTAADGYEQIVETQPDIALIDLSLPDTSGIDLAIQLKNEGVSSCLIAFTTATDVQHIRKALAAGMVGYVLKEEAFSSLIEALQTVAGGGVYISPRANLVLATSQHTKPDSLSAREQEVLDLIAAGQTNKEIADILGVTVATIKTHRQRLMKKLDLHSVADLTRYALRHAL